MAKYFEYDGSDTVAFVMQMVFFYLSHQLIKGVLKCFGADEDEYINLSLPEIKINVLKAIIVTRQKEIDDVSGDGESQDNTKLYEKIDLKIKKNNE